MQQRQIQIIDCASSTSVRRARLMSGSCESTSRIHVSETAIGSLLDMKSTLQWATNSSSDILRPSSPQSAVSSPPDDVWCHPRKRRSASSAALPRKSTQRALTPFLNSTGKSLRDEVEKTNAAAKPAPSSHRSHYRRAVESIHPTPTVASRRAAGSFSPAQLKAPQGINDRLVLSFNTALA